MNTADYLREPISTIMDSWASPESSAPASEAADHDLGVPVEDVPVLITLRRR
jgi:hypothetical protein